MKIIISPAKKMNVNTDIFPCPELPVFLKRTRDLMNYMKGLSYEDAKKLSKHHRCSGGANIDLSNGSVYLINNTINTGGMNVIGTPLVITDIDSNINVGGLNIQSDSLEVKSNNIELGGTSLRNISSNDTHNKIRLNSDIQVGGANLISTDH